MTVRGGVGDQVGKNFLSCPGSDMKKWPRLFTLLLALGLFIPLLVLLFTTSWQQSANVHLIRKGKQKNSKPMIDVSVFLDSATDHQHNNPLHNWMRSQCEALQLPVEKALKVSAFNHIIVNHQHKVLYCQVPKVACTNWRRIFIILSGQVQTRNPMTLKAYDVHKKYDRHLTYLGDLSTREIKKVLREYFKFVIVREPFERLLSAYRNKLQGQTNSSKFFHMRFGRKIIKRYRDNPSDESLDLGNDVTFPEFVQYILDPGKKETLNEHWAQFHDLCHPCLISYDFVGKYHSLQQDSDFVLNTIGVSDFIQFPPRSASYKYKKTESLLPQYYKTIPRQDMKNLWKVYQPDFVLFNYTVPSSIQSLVTITT